MVRAVRSDGQDFIAESRFSWGQLRGGPDSWPGSIRVLTASDGGWCGKSME